MNYFWGYLLIANIVSFLVFFWDKRAAIHHKWRIPEIRLFLCAILFGSFGAWLGMVLLRHKTKHRKFVYGIPAIMAVQLLIVYYLKFA